MKAYRITHPEYAEDLSGKGAWLHGGRWNPKGTWMLYTAEAASLAVLELLGHVRGLSQPLPFVIVQLDLSGSNVLELNQFTHALPLNWASEPHGNSLTQKIGENWLKSNASAVLKVPSVHSPFENNILINPHHSALKIAVSEKHWYLHDFRLIEK